MKQSLDERVLMVRDLGRMPYAPALELQRQAQRAVIAARGTVGESAGGGVMTLLLVEHDPPVITISRRRGAADHLTATPQQLAAAGVEIAETDRGGDITYHGPGQLVVYPILDLNVLGLRLAGYMRWLEQIVIDVLKRFAIAGVRDEAATGVWVDEGSRNVAPGLDHVHDAERRATMDRVHDAERRATSKICALGVRVSRWVSMHGLALNVTTNLDHFNLIVPCGLAGRPVTSMQRLLGESCPSMDDVKRAMVDQFRDAVQRCTPSPFGRGQG